jgi:hypothetical protein
MQLAALVVRAFVWASVVALLSIAHYHLALVSFAVSLATASISAAVFVCCLFLTITLKRRSPNRSMVALSATMLASLVALGTWPIGTLPAQFPMTADAIRSVNQR